MADDNDDRMPALGQSRSDDLAALIRGASSVLPFGGILAEVVTEIFSDRQERLEEYARCVSRRLTELEVEITKLREKENRALFEEGARLSKEQIHGGRIRFIAESVARGISDDVRAKLRSARLIGIVAQLDPEELEILRGFSISDHMMFDRLRPDARDRENMEIWNAMWAKLETLKLIEFVPRTEKLRVPSDRGGQAEIKLPSLDITGRPSGYRRLTSLGAMILASVGLAESQKQVDASRSDTIKAQ